MNTGVIIQARMGSTRLPGKVMINILGKSVLSHIIDRVKQSKLINTIVVATSNLCIDDAIEIEAKNNDVEVYRGSENDVLSRYYQAAQVFNIDNIIRITSDCPFMDPKLLDDMISKFLNEDTVFLTNVGLEKAFRTYPRGLDIEIMSYDLLAMTAEVASEDYHREHVTPYIYENCKGIFYYKNIKDYSNYRLTLDTKSDLLLTKEIYKYFYVDKHDFYLQDIIELLESDLELIKINRDIEQKYYKSRD